MMVVWKQGSMADASAVADAVTLTGRLFWMLQSQCYVQEGVDEEHEFARLKQSMEMVGFSPETQRK